jgi:hypothetical protein
LNPLALDLGARVTGRRSTPPWSISTKELDDAARQLDQVVRNASSSKAAQRSAAR